MADAVDPLLGLLLEMGFDRPKAEKALSATGHSSVENAMEWILAHGDDKEPTDQTGEQTGAPTELHLPPMTEEQRAEQVKKLEEKRLRRRAEKEEEERRLEIEREKARRVSGKEILDAKDKAAQAEMMKIAEERRRDKEEDRKHRERIKNLIEEDRLNRNKGEKKDVPSSTPTPFSSPVSSSADLTGKTRIQIRMFDGKALSNTFGAQESLSAVRLFVEINRQDGDSSPFGLMTNFPKREFTEEDMGAPLASLGLVPSATLIATRKHLT